MSFTEQAFRIVDPKLEQQGEIFQLTPGSPAINAALSAYDYVGVDRDGTPRDSQPDIGASEFVPGPGGTPFDSAPLDASSVGPTATAPLEN